MHVEWLGGILYWIFNVIIRQYTLKLMPTEQREATVFNTFKHIKRMMTADMGITDKYINISA